MRETFGKKWVVVGLFIALLISFSYSAKTYADQNTQNKTSSSAKKNKPAALSKNNIKDTTTILANGITHRKVKRWLSGKPAVVNIIVVNPKESNAIIKPAYGSYFVNNIKRVKDIVGLEDAIAGINASYFKPDNGAPLGASIINSEIITGPLFRRVSLGITKDKEFKMSRIDIRGEIKIGENTKLSLFNINQPVFSSKHYSVYTDKWGKYTPKTSPYYSHIVVSDNKIQYIKNSRVAIPTNGFVVVGPHNLLPKDIKVDDTVYYTARIVPDDWNDVEYAIGGGPYLVKDGKVYIDRQRFSKHFLWSKSPRTAVGYTKSGNLVLVTVDGRFKGFTEGATIGELAKIMQELGCYNAMNLDGGTSTQMVINGRIVNYPTVKGGSRVTNAIVIIKPPYNYELSDEQVKQLNI